MPLLLVLLELVVGTVAAWVLTFEVGLYARASVRVVAIVFLLIWSLLIVAMARPWVRRIRVCGRKEIRFARNTLVIGCLVGLLVLVASRPDADDIGYMYQTLVDASSPDGKFTVEPFIVPFHGKRIEVPFLSENEAYEAMVAVMANLVGVDPLQAYHNFFAFLAAIVWVVTYAVLFRRFRVPGNRVWLALLATVMFLLLDGNLHRSFGNFSLLRIWQGKIIVWAIFRPAFLLFSLRFLSRPNWYTFGLLATTGALSFFINRSSIFLFAVLGMAVAASYALGFTGSRRRTLRALVLALTVTPLWVVGAYIAWSSVPSGSSVSSVLSEIVPAPGPPQAMPAPSSRFGSSWWASLNRSVIGGPLTLLRDILFLTVLPFLVVRRPLNRFIFLLSFAVAILGLNPITGPVWYYFFYSVYWRLYYALPLPLCAGLVALLVVGLPVSRCRTVIRIALAGALVVTTGLAIDRPALSKANDVQLKHPFEYRFRHEALNFTRSATPFLEGKLVLATEEVAVILALTEFDSIDLVYIRALSPGSVTNLTSQLVSRCKINARTANALGRLLKRRVDAVVMSACDDAAMEKLRKLLTRFRLEEEKAVADAEFRLYWVRPEPRTPPRRSRSQR